MPDDRADRLARGEGRKHKRAWIKVGPGGRIVIPVATRRTLGIVEGEYVQALVQGDELRLIPQETVYRRVQDAVAERVPTGVSLVDELLAERRREAEREERGE